MQLDGDKIKAILGKQQTVAAPKKRIKLSNAPNDDMDADDIKDLVSKSGMRNDYAPAMTKSIAENGMITPDQGDVVRKLRDKRVKDKANYMAAKVAATSNR